MTVTIATDLLDAIERAARDRYPEEACGLLVGRPAPPGCTVTAVHESPNVAEDRRSGFEVDPGLRLRLQRETRKVGEAVLGLFHSHPEGTAAPSETDRASIWEPDLIWLITAVARGDVHTRAFAVDQTEKGFVPLSLRAV